LALAPGQLQLDPDISAGPVPTRWRLTVPDHGVDLMLSAPPGNYTNDGLYPYWESPVTVTGSHTGVGYMELTGYSGQ
jgi:predicted secreted hydrolase